MVVTSLEALRVIWLVDSSALPDDRAHIGAVMEVCRGHCVLLTQDKHIYLYIFIILASGTTSEDTPKVGAKALALCGL